LGPGSGTAIAVLFRGLSSLPGTCSQARSWSWPCVVQLWHRAIERGIHSVGRSVGLGPPRSSMRRRLPPSQHELRCRDHRVDHLPLPPASDFGIAGAVVGPNNSRTHKEPLASASRTRIRSNYQAPKRTSTPRFGRVLQLILTKLLTAHQQLSVSDAETVSGALAAASELRTRGKVC